MLRRRISFGLLILSRNLWMGSSRPHAQGMILCAKAGMWIEFVTQYKMTSHGQDIFMTQKVVIQPGP